MRVDQIEVGKTYEGGKAKRIRKFLRVRCGWAMWEAANGSASFTRIEDFARWAVREVPHAN